ncbi:MAG: energy transducer TonB [Thermodesulfovibrionales bacterium]|nr:energy transducer TonB [Thermodesulfovibrionales bacterium]
MILKRTLILSVLLHALVFCLAALASFSGREKGASERVFFVELGAQGQKEGTVSPAQKPDTVKASLSPSAAKPTPLMPPLMPRTEKAEQTEIAHQGKSAEDASAMEISPFEAHGSFPGTGAEADAAYGGKGLENTDFLMTIIKEAIEKAKTYPELARKRKMEGTVHAEFFIDENGMPKDIRVLESSGFSLLDDEVVRIIKRASPYPPLKEVVEVPVSFSLRVANPLSAL